MFFVTRILGLSFFNEFIKRNIKGDFDEKKAINSLNKCKLFIENIYPSNLCRKNVTLLSTFKAADSDTVVYNPAGFS